MEPCEPEHYLAAWREKGQECARIDLLEGNREASDLIGVSLQEHVRWLAPLLYREMASRMTEDERRGMLYRVRAVLQSQPVLDALYPTRQTEEEDPGGA